MDLEDPSDFRVFLCVGPTGIEDDSDDVVAGVGFVKLRDGVF